MFVYNGFLTKSQEFSYFQKVAQILQILQTTLLKVLQYRTELISKADVKGLTTSFQKIFQSLKDMESQKHSDPKFSYFCSEMMKFLEENQPFDSRSSHERTKRNDFQMLDDCLALDNSRDDTRVLRASPVIRDYGKEDYLKSSRLKLDRFKDPNRRFTPMLRRSTPDKGISGFGKKKGRKNSPAQMYHDQAMALLTVNL
jgi:hypothetical protein